MRLTHKTRKTHREPELRGGGYSRYRLGLAAHAGLAADPINRNMLRAWDERDLWTYDVRDT